MGMKMLEKISALLEEKRIGQLEFEEQAKLAKNRISKWKAGKGEPTGRQLCRMARILGVPPEYLADDAATTPPISEFTDEERFVIRVFRTTGLDADTAVRRLTQAPVAKPVGPSYEDLGPAEKRRRNGDRGA